MNLVSREEAGTNCCYAKQDKFWVTDPDGIQWEVYYFHADAEFNDPHYETNDAVTCCTVSEESTKATAAAMQPFLQGKRKLFAADTSTDNFIQLETMLFINSSQR
jgi:hypothetical protein